MFWLRIGSLSEQARKDFPPFTWRRCRLERLAYTAPLFGRLSERAEGMCLPTAAREHRDSAVCREPLTARGRHHGTAWTPIRNAAWNCSPGSSKAVIKFELREQRVESDE